MNAHYLTTILNLYINIYSQCRANDCDSFKVASDWDITQITESQRNIMQFGSKGNIKLRLRERASEEGSIGWRDYHHIY